MRATFPVAVPARILLGALLLAGSTLSAQDAEWVMNRRIGPPPGFAGTGYYVNGLSRAFGDFDADGYPDFLCSTILVHPSNRSEVLLRVIDGAGLAVRWEVTVDPSLIQANPFSSILLATPSEVLVAALSHSTSLVLIYSPSRQQLVARIPLPPSPGGGLPAPSVVADIVVAGDVDGDGYDDLYAKLTATDSVSQQHYVVVGLIGGASMNYVWIRYLPSTIPETRSPVPLFDAPWQDLDNDGWTDVVFAANDATGSAVRALSGRDGSVMWEAVRAGDSLTLWAIVGDLDRDGIRDVGCVTAIDWLLPAGSRTPGSIRALDGATGALLWDNPYGLLLPWLNTPGDQRRVAPHGMAGSGDHDRDGHLDVIVDMHEAADLFDPGYEMAWAFGGHDGAFLGREATALTQFPWSSEPLQGAGSRSIDFLFSYPDIDRDGWPERAAAYYVPNSGYSVARDLIILQRRTLRVGAQLHLGSAANYELDLPACGGLSYAVLFSSSFSPWPGGLRFGPWNVALGIDPVLLASSREPALSGVLGPNGVAQGTFPMSSDARLLGRTLFSRAVVLDAAAPGGVRTLSSIEYSTVVP